MFTNQLDICARTNLFAVKAMHISKAQAPQHYDAAILPQKKHRAHEDYYPCALIFFGYSARAVRHDDIYSQRPNSPYIAAMVFCRSASFTPRMIFSSLEP